MDPHFRGEGEVAQYSLTVYTGQSCSFMTSAAIRGVSR
jgi:hypothetical protein